MTFEEMKAELYRRDEETLNYTPSDEYCEGVHDGLHEAAKLVSITDPVKHGRWNKDSDAAFYWRCSECGCYLFWRKEDYLLRHEDEPNYCPNCGAKMDGGDA